MSAPFDLIMRQARLHGGLADVGMRDGRIAAIADRLGRSDRDIDAGGRLLIPGLHDHHIHLLASAAQGESVDLAGMLDADSIMRAVRKKAASVAPGQWVRATGYDERAAGLPDRNLLDQWLPHTPVRLQDRTGALWALNSPGCALLGDAPWPDCVEVDGAGSPTGRIWRGDDWLRSRTGSMPPSLEPLSRRLAGWGVTSITDAGAKNGPEEAAILVQAVECGALRQQLTLMGNEDLPESTVYQRDALKMLFDERDLPDLGAIARRIAAARAQGRTVAAHCVTDGELAVWLAALEMAGGAREGDRIEHGSLIPGAMIGGIARAGLTVVANPGFLAWRGDRYLSEVLPDDRQNLHRLKSLIGAGIRLMAGSDAPYGPLNPWVAIRSAMSRQTPSGAVLGAEEALTPGQALALYAGDRPIAVGERGNLCLIETDWIEQLGRNADLNPVHLTIIGCLPC